MNCKNCGAPMKFEHQKIIYTCEYCTSTYFLEESRDGLRVTDIESGASCPLCRLPLFQAYIGKIEVSSCTRCRGVLISQPDFLNAIQYIRSKAGAEMAPSPLRMEELKRKISCPRCSKPMHTHPYAGPGNIAIDNCPDCMVNWLDANELYRITHAPDGSNQGRSRMLDIDEDVVEKLFGSRKKR